MDYWAKAPLVRDQKLLFHPTLDQMIGEDHPVRLLDEILRGRDWAGWEAEYHGGRGQPPIPPCVLAGVILYGLMRGLRSSRVLEYLCSNAIDFLWLAEGRTLDHTTICKFRKRFRRPLRDLFVQVGRLAMTMGLVRLIDVAFDGTRVKAHASRHHTWTTARIAAALQELETRIEKMLAEADAVDGAEDRSFGPDESGNRLPPELATLKDRRAKLKAAQERLQEADESRKKEGIDPQKNPAQMPKADPDARVMPNKEGGYAPNYTPVAAVDGQGGLIVDADVISDPNEHEQTLAAVDRIEENFHQKPERFLADTAHGTGENLAGMVERSVEFYSPVESSDPQEGNPARREDPRQAVAEADWPKLPRNDKRKLAKSCFVYDPQADVYYCPLGKPLRYQETKKELHRGKAVSLRVYRCGQCEGCALATDCREENAKRGRSIRRDGYEPLREEMFQRMQSAAGKAIYGRRMPIAETPFGCIKLLMGVRQFLLRGRENVKTEWLWVCTAFNLKKILLAVARLRARFGAMTSEAVV